MVKKTKKASKQFFDNVIEYEGDFDFPKLYEDWKASCKKHDSKAIMSMGRMKDGKRERTNPKDLYDQLEEHVTAAYRRPNSPNKGNTGTYKLLQQIDKFFTKTYKGVLLEAHRPILLNFKRKLSKFNQAGSTLNPRNITFTRPARFETRGKNKGKAIGDKTIVIYGHYADEYYKAKYEGKAGYQGVAPDSWIKTVKNKANPPLAQALFGGGELVSVGLIQVVNTAIQELDKGYHMVIKVKGGRVQDLSTITSLRKHVFKLLRDKSMFRKGGRPNLSAMASSLMGVRFQIGERATGDKRLVHPKRIIAYVTKTPKPSGEIKSFSFGETIGTTAMASLIRKVVKKKQYRLRWGEFLNMKGMTVPKEEKNEVKKAWIEYLWG
jgi:hypothetical protein